MATILVDEQKFWESAASLLEGLKTTGTALIGLMNATKEEDAEDEKDRKEDMEEMMKNPIVEKLEKIVEERDFEGMVDFLENERY